MASSGRTSANRANALRSTGPRSVEGKAQSRLNALKHGLAIPAAVLPELAHDITELARKLAGSAAGNPSVLQAAIDAVAAAVDVNRVRRARRNLLEQMRADPDFHVPPLAKEHMPDRPERTRFTMAMRVQAYRDRTRDEQRRVEIAQIMEQVAYEAEVERIKLDRADAKQRALQWDQLARLERYERRAVSRRNSAIRAFDEVRSEVQNDR